MKKLEQQIETIEQQLWDDPLWQSMVTDYLVSAQLGLIRDAIRRGTSFY